MSTKRSNQHGYIDIEFLIGAICGLLIVAALIALPIVTFNWVNTKETHVCKVTNKESVSKDKTHEYRVYTDKCGVFTVKDEAWLGKFNSADTYGKIQSGSSYTFQTVGWRNGFFSTFPNIVEATQ